MANSNPRRKAVFLIGAPGTGKTTLAKLFMDELRKIGGVEGFSSAGTIPYTQFHWGARRREWRILGKFDGDGYAQGTDRMSMGVQPHFATFIHSNRANLLIEGDRLANMKSITALQEQDYEVIAVFLDADDFVLSARYAQRGSNQSETFLKGRHTKVRNLSVMARRTKGLQVIEMPNEHASHQGAILAELMRLV